MDRLLPWVIAGVLSAHAGIASATIKLQDADPKKHDRFYDPSDPDKAFIGDPHDWSGVGRRSKWATMISPSYYLTSMHNRQVGGELYFYHTNDPNPDLRETRDVDIPNGQQIGGSDLWLGKLTEPVSEDVAKYPIFVQPNKSDYYGLEIYTYGLSEEPQSSPTSMRLGRNNVDPFTIIPRTVGDPPATGESYLFDFDDPGGVGDDESYLQGQDSGAPSFVIHNGSPAVVGIHWFIEDPPPEVSGDTFVSAYFDAVNAAMIGEYAAMAPDRVTTWFGLGDGSWHSAIRWIGGGIPDSTTRAIVPANTVTLSADGEAQSVLVHENARLVVEPASTLRVVTSVEVDDGTLDVRGTVDADFIQLADGGSLNVAVTGSLSVRDELVLEDAECVFEFDGSTGGLLDAARTVTLGDDTTLTLRATGMLDATGDATRTIVTADGINGSFDVVPAESDHLGYGVFFQGIDYTAEAVDLDLLQAIGGDTDGDRDVDFADFNNLANHYTGDLLPGVGEKDWLQGDFDGDADVDFADFNSLANNYTGVISKDGILGLSDGQEDSLLAWLGGELELVLQSRISAGELLVGTTPGAVPEPDSLVLLGIAGLGLLLWTIRQRHGA